MSTSQKIKSLVPYIAPEGMAIYEDIKKDISKFLPEYQWQRLVEAVELEEDEEYLLELIDELQMATAYYIDPNLDRYHTHKHDLMRYFDLCERFVKMSRLDGIRLLLPYYRDVFRDPKKICAHIRTTCTNRECDGKFTSIEQLVCEKCDTPRTVCHNRPESFGRCSNSVHSGHRRAHSIFKDGSVPGRARIYSRNMQGELRDMYIEAMSDPDFLSVQPEISALATRSGQLMKDLGDTDYLAISTAIRQAVKRMSRARAEDDQVGMIAAARDIEEQLNAVADDKRRWDEIASIAGRLGRLSETERKRIIEAQKVITVPEMYIIQQETLARVRDSLAIVAARVVKIMDRGEKISQPKLRQIMLTTLHKVMQGDLNAEQYLMEDMPLVEEPDGV